MCVLFSSCSSRIVVCAAAYVKNVCWGRIITKLQLFVFRGKNKSYDAIANANAGVRVSAHIYFNLFCLDTKMEISQMSICLTYENLLPVNALWLIWFVQRSCDAQCANCERIQTTIFARRAYRLHCAIVSAHFIYVCTRFLLLVLCSGWFWCEFFFCGLVRFIVSFILNCAHINCLYA